MKKILFSADARKRIKAGIDKCVDVVKVSMGGNGKNVLVFNGHISEIINDGVSIAREVNVKDEIEQAGIQLAKQCAAKTDEDAGDGTTTTLVLLQSILNELITDFPTENPRELREKLFQEANEILAKIEVKQIEKKEDLYNLALTSSLNEEIAKVVSDVYWEVGKDGKITIEEVSRNVLEGEVVNGMQIETNKASLIKKEGREVFEDVDVLIIDKAETAEQIQPVVEKASKRGSNTVIVISNGFTRSVLLSIEKTNSFNIIPLEYKNLKSMDDIKSYIGEEPVDKIIIDDKEATIIGGKGKVGELIETLKKKMEDEQSSYEKEALETRIAGLSGGIGIIRVGRQTEVETNEYSLKIEDALGSVKGAYDSGYCVGGGLALKNAAEGSSERLRRVCESPYNQILENGATEIPEGVIDSFRSVKSSLLNALSTATSIATVEAALIEENED